MAADFFLILQNIYSYSSSLISTLQFFVPITTAMDKSTLPIYFIYRNKPLKMQVQLLFLQWMPWFLRMARPGEKITRKTIMMQKKMKDLDMKETSSKSLLTNVLDMDDDFRNTTLPHNFFSQHPSHVTPSQNNSNILRYVLFFVIWLRSQFLW